MSIPPSVPVPKLVDRLLKAAAGLSVGDVAARLGVDSSYVSQLRTGYRPQRMGAERRARLVALVEELEAGYDSGRAAAVDRTEFYDGVLFAAQAMSETVTRLLAEARAGLRAEAPPAKRHSPTAGEIAIGLEVLRAADAAQASSRRGKSG